MQYSSVDLVDICGEVIRLVSLLALTKVVTLHIGSLALLLNPSESVELLVVSRSGVRGLCASYRMVFCESTLLDLILYVSSIYCSHKHKFLIQGI